MSTYIDKKYINMVSCLLPKFKWKKDNLANCRCPLCGDSDKSKSKARGYFYKKGNDFFFKCHNCGIGHNLYNILERISPSLCKEYSIERYISGENGKSNYIKPAEEVTYPFIKQQIKFDSISNFTQSTNLDPSHICSQFIVDRKIPKDRWCDIGYTEDFSVFSKQFNTTYILKQEPRIIILIRNIEGDIIGAQGRVLPTTLDKKAPKYITLRKNEDEKLIFGIDRIDTSKQIYVVEGPLDSMFLPNCIACLGSSSFMEVAKQYKNACFVLDNEPRNRDTTGIQKDLIDMGYTVCVWPRSIKEKDINDMVLNTDIEKTVDVIKNNSCIGLKAQLAFNDWKRC